MDTLYLVQHGQAKAKNEDPERPLTSQGRRETQRIADMAARLDLGIQKIWHSDKTRAKETAVIFGETLGLGDKVTAVDGLHPTDDVQPIAEDLAEEANPVMLVGHLPFMPRLVGQLVRDDPEKSPVEFRYSGIVCLACEDGSWRVDWQLNPG